MATKILTRLNLVVLCLLITLNFIAIFMPELGFDALWYHLTLSKLFLSKHQWYFPGGLYYYSAMPRLGELISLPLLAKLGFIGPKFVQFLSGLVIAFFIHHLAKKFTGNRLISLSAVNLFYATWLVSWQSSSAYVDLIRTVFETATLYFLIHKPLSVRWKLVAGVCLGLAIGVKWHALGSLLLLALIFSPLVVIPAAIVASPWFYLAYHFTSNPVYPVFEKFMTQTQLAQVSPHFYTLSQILQRLFLFPIFITKPAEDFISPVIGLVFLISLPALLSSKIMIRKIAFYGLFGSGLLLLTPPPSPRYYLPYLPPVIIAATYLLSRLKQKIATIFLVIFTLSAIFIFGLRLVAFSKYLPFLTGQLSLNRFLASQSQRLPDTFIDADDYIANNLPPRASYLIANLHNLYYFPYDFDHESFASNRKRYDYLITKNMKPENITGKLIHTNSLGIQIFKL